MQNPFTRKSSAAHSSQTCRTMPGVKGLQTRLGQGTLDEIKNFLKEKRPVIVLVDLGFWVLSQPHYLVITGFNDTGFIAHTGYQAGKLFGYSEFEKIWKKKGSVYLLVWR